MIHRPPPSLGRVPILGSEFGGRETVLYFEGSREVTVAGKPNLKTNLFDDEKISRQQ